MLDAQELFEAFAGTIPLERLDGSGVCTEGGGWTMAATVEPDTRREDVRAVS